MQMIWEMWSEGQEARGDHTQNKKSVATGMIALECYEM